MLNIENIYNIFQPNFDLLVSLFVFASISLLIYFLVLKIILVRKYLTQKYIFLEIRPTDRTLKTSLSTTQLFNILHSLEKPYTWFERFIKFKKNISYELVSTKQDGIRFILRITKEDVSSIRKTLLAYLSGIEIKEISDYLDHKNNIQPHSVTRELILSKSFVYPLTPQSNLIQHDPLAYLTAHMTKLWPNEVVVLQFVCTSVDKNTHAKETSLINELSKKLLNNEDISSILSGGNYNYIFDFIGSALAFIVLTPVTLISWLVSGSEQPFPSWVFKSSQKLVQKSNGTTKTELYTNIATKISQPLFETTIRVYISSNTKERSVERQKGIVSSFDTFASQYQSIKLKRSIFKTIKQKSLQKLYYLLLKNRLSLFTSRTILSADELSSMYHFPFTSTTKTEDLLQVKSPKLPAPISLKKSDLELDITFAQNAYGETTTPIGLTLEERRRHAYIIGSTGTGKTTLLLQMIYQDINKGNGLAVIDPHGDLSDRLIGIIPENRINDVVYLNPYDVEYPIGLNVLELPKGLSPVEEQREKDFITSTLISIFHKLYDPRYSGPRMEHILRNVILTALEQDNPTLFTIYQLLTDKNYRKKAVSLLNDEILKTFWKNEFDKLGSFQRAEQISPITNKLGRFLTTSMTRNILNQTDSKLNFDTIMNQKKILICNLAKGKIGEDTAYFLGSLITAKIQLSALRRVHIPEKERTDFFLYIDEFQNFATQSFAEILSEARKYRLSVILAHQNTVQIENDLLETIIGNTGTLICFRTSSPQDEMKLLPVFAPEVEKGQIANLPSYNFYMKINALQPQATFSGEIDDFSVTTDENIREEVITHSRDTYGQLFTKSVSKAKQQKVIADATKKNNDDEIKKPQSIFEKIRTN